MVEEKKPELVFLNTEEIAPPPFKIRNEKENEFSGDMFDMIRSVKAQGVIEPVVVRPRPDGGMELVVGSRRLQAARHALAKTVPALVREMSDVDALEAMLVENIHRRDISDVQKGFCLKKLMEIAMDRYPSQEALAKRVGKSQQWVSYHIQAYETAEELKRDHSTTRVVKRSGVDVDNLSEYQLRAIAQVESPKERRYVLRQVIKERERGGKPIEVKPSLSARRIEAKLREEQLKTNLDIAMQHVLSLITEGLEKVRVGLAEFLRNYPKSEFHERVWRKLAGEIAATIEELPYHLQKHVLKELREELLTSNPLALYLNTSSACRSGFLPARRFTSTSFRM